MPDAIVRTTLHDLPARVRREVIGLLNQRLADLLDLQSHARHAHWNVRGPQFIALHELFDDVVEALDGAIDDVAERAVQLGGEASGLLRGAAEASTLKGYNASKDAKSKAGVGGGHVRALAKSLAAVAASVRGAIDEAAKAGDAGTADLFTGVSRMLDKQLWFVESHLM